MSWLVLGHGGGDFTVCSEALWKSAIELDKCALGFLVWAPRSRLRFLLPEVHAPTGSEISAIPYATIWILTIATYEQSIV